MAVTNIPNQPIRFRNSDSISEDCDCLGQNFCQLVNKNDATKFQVSSSNRVSNGTFESNLDGWVVFESITVLASITNESAEDECDGELEIIATGGTAPYTYSINGGSFGASNTFSDLCPGSYLITVLDDDGNEGSLYVTIFTNIVCGDYEGTTIDELTTDGVTLGQLYNCTFDDLKP